ncbi:MAG: class I SAM-dependent methyltransferase [Chloroflexi bacterium]|nr:class I SAM-dependent methyltransferase [Chloroflexota bacterium]
MTQPVICDYEGSRYRDDFWPGREYEDAAERIALRHLLPTQGRALVEIGAGFGRLADLYRGYDRVVLVDYARSQLGQARERLGNDQRLVYVAADIYRLPLADSAYDTAVTVRVLHHLKEVPSALAEVHRILAPQGTYVLEYANKRNLKEILRYMLGRSRKRPFSLEPSEFAPLNFNFHPAYIDQQLRRAGFRISKELAVSHFRLGLLKRLVPAPTLARLDGWLQGPAAPWKLSPSIFIAAIAEKLARPQPDALFQCPFDRRGTLIEANNRLRCPICGREWTAQEGIYDLRI